MKNFGAIVFLLASAGSLVTSTPAFRNESRVVSADSAHIAARALELVPRVRVGSRSNETETPARFLGIPRSANSTDETAVGSLVTRRNGNFSEVATEKLSAAPHLRRGKFGFRSASNETDA
ncbi:uncharacterized protein F4812DRAFT_139612 [Daldinia caldariorum]|uniref:uncharacterized protein n=1 Tax=Daldinia caldariorum TaxID=326644 RepID=UPI0020083A33|nr:uncharacterized protein F4812DRAFT_139612 [Daldinia caldariorum]KAI1464809.1 hypothetical protein F4812DRAFT_139612 [Daldinia caldariorum]